MVAVADIIKLLYYYKEPILQPWSVSSLQLIPASPYDQYSDEADGDEEQIDTE